MHFWLNIIFAGKQIKIDHGKYTQLHIIHKNKLKVDHRRRCEIIKVLKENTAESLCDLGLDNYFLNMTPKIQYMKEKIDILDFTKMKIYS